MTTATSKSVPSTRIMSIRRYLLLLGRSQQQPKQLQPQELQEEADLKSLHDAVTTTTTTKTKARAEKSTCKTARCYTCRLFLFGLGRRHTTIKDKSNSSGNHQEEGTNSIVTHLAQNLSNTNAAFSNGNYNNPRFLRSILRVDSQKTTRSRSNTTAYSSSGTDTTTTSTSRRGGKVVKWDASVLSKESSTARKNNCSVELLSEHLSCFQFDGHEQGKPPRQYCRHSPCLKGPWKRHFRMSLTLYAARPMA
jgi:hypothetical protein